MPDTVNDVFERHLPDRLRAKPDLVGKVGAIYQFHIGGAGGGEWTVDCTVPGGVITRGVSGAARCTVACSDADFLGIMNGRVSPHMAFMMGKLRIQGDMGLAMKLAQILT